MLYAPLKKEKGKRQSFTFAAAMKDSFMKYFKAHISTLKGRLAALSYRLIKQTHTYTHTYNSSEIQKLGLVSHTHNQCIWGVIHPQNPKNYV